MTSLLEAASAAAGKGTTGEVVEAFAVDTLTTLVRARGGEVQVAHSSKTRGVGIRVLLGEQMGFAATTELGNADAVRDTLAEARANAHVSHPDVTNQLLTSYDKPENCSVVDPRVEEATIRAKVKTTLQLDSLISSDERLVGFGVAEYSDAVAHKALACSSGEVIAWSEARFRCAATVHAIEGSIRGTGRASRHGGLPRHIDLRELAEEALTLARNTLGAAPIEASSSPTLLSPRATAGIIAAIAPALCAHQVLAKNSWFAQRLGEAVASPIVTLVDDPCAKGAFLTRPFDDEGVTSRKTALIQDGRLEAFLHNLKTASALQAKATGNAERDSYSTPVGISPSNAFLHPGSIPPDGLLQEVDKGLYILDYESPPEAIELKTGALRFAAVGLKVSRGELAGPVRLRVSVPIHTLLRSVVGVASDLTFSGSRYGAPSVLLETLPVS